MSTMSPAPQRRGISGLGLLVLLVLVILGYSAVRNLLDWNGYTRGHQAYQQADCAQAIEYFDSVINGWRLADMGQFVARAEQQKSECVPFQAAVDKQQGGEYGAALLAYMGFMDEYQAGVLVETARSRIAAMFGSIEPSSLASQDTCAVIDTLLGKNLVLQTDAYLPPFYLACGRVYDSVESWESSSAMYKALLTDYPAHSLAAEAERSLIANPFSCEETEALKNSVIAQRNDFMPTLYYQCGRTSEKNADWVNAIAAYEKFLAEYPNHALATDVETALARSIVTQSQANSAGEIPAPERSGTTGSQLTEVVIQNDSPERLRIVFSGPEARVEELEACPTCMKYTGTGPLYCPELGPIGRYTLMPGQYDVVVQAISDSGVTPWTGKWDLSTGDEYSQCFYIVSTLLQ